MILQYIIKTRDVAGHQTGESFACCGQIRNISNGEDILVELRVGHEIELPPDLAMLGPAPPRTYVLRPSGEKVANPGYIT